MAQHDRLKKYPKGSQYQVGGKSWQAGVTESGKKGGDTRYYKEPTTNPPKGIEVVGDFYADTTTMTPQAKLDAELREKRKKKYGGMMTKKTGWNQ